MLIESAITATTSKGNIQIQKPPRKLIVTKTTAEFSAETISLKLIKGGNSNTICNGDKITVLSEIAQFQEGALKTFKTGTKSVAVIDLSMSGAIALKDSDYLSLQLDNLTATATYQVFALEDFVRMREYVEYSRLQTLTSTSSTSFAVNTDDCRLLSIDAISALTEIQCVDDNGNTANFTFDELEVLMRDSNDIVSYTAGSVASGVAGDTIKFGYDTQFILNVTNIKQVTLVTTGASVVGITKVVDKSF